jgi:hypothetical protein
MMTSYPREPWPQKALQKWSEGSLISSGGATIAPLFPSAEPLPLELLPCGLLLLLLIAEKSP